MFRDLQMIAYQGQWIWSIKLLCLRLNWLPSFSSFVEVGLLKWASWGFSDHPFVILGGMWIVKSRASGHGGSSAAWPEEVFWRGKSDSPGNETQSLKLFINLSVLVLSCLHVVSFVYWLILPYRLDHLSINSLSLPAQCSHQKWKFRNARTFGLTSKCSSRNGNFILRAWLDSHNWES